MDTQWFLSWKLAIQKFMSEMNALSWQFALIGGLILTICGAGIGSFAEIASVTIVSALIAIRKYLAKKLPEWLDKALSKAIILFLSKLFYSVLVFLFLGFAA